jgi:hypothetical protein
MFKKTSGKGFRDFPVFRLGFDNPSQQQMNSKHSF